MRPAARPAVWNTNVHQERVPREVRAAAQRLEGSVVDGGLWLYGWTLFNCGWLVVG